MRSASRLIFSAMVSVALLGCGQTPPPNAALPPPNATPPLSSATLPPVEVPAILSDAMLAEQESVPDMAQSPAPDPTAGETSEEFFEDDGFGPSPIESKARESEAKRQQMEDRWLLLTDRERARIIAIKESLVENPGIILTPDDFLFVYRNENEIFVERELRAAAATSCGPLIDFLGERLGWSTEQRIAALGVFAINCRSEFAKDEHAQEWHLLQAKARYEEDMRDGGNTDDIDEDHIRLGVLAEVLNQRSRTLTDSEMVFLRELAPDALREFLTPGPKLVARGPDRKAPIERDKAFERAAVGERERINAARDSALKDIPTLLRRLESLYEKRNRLARAARETVTGNRAREETKRSIAEDEAALSASLLALFNASDDPKVISGEDGPSSEPPPPSVLRHLTDRRQKALLDAFPHNLDVKRFVERLNKGEQSMDDPYPR